MITELKKLIVQLAAYYEKDLSDEQIVLYANDLASLLSFDEALTAAAAYRRDPENTFFPRPISKLVKYARPERPDSDAALEVAASIIKCVKRHGYPNGTEARAEMGEVGWAVVQAFGGWATICEIMNDKNIPTYTAQFRELAKAKIADARAGRFDETPTLPAPSNLNRLTRLIGPIVELKKL